ncbi:hypothetical protein PIB30_028091 [Stylosanthes scabra]|uniref:Nucleotide-diphospho-sugar transferase domain-containing protein n=1 Tax=Stylosanthes scabra TaxID=79078 RepID=A0ABU6TBI8_9FABA|nr:hypothetical protein [Stylosanthes scabra]
METSVNNKSNKELVARGGHSKLLVRRPMQIFIFFVGFAFMLMFLYNDTSAFGIPLLSRFFIASPATISDNPKLESVLKIASMEDSTVIITTLNDAWVEPNSMFDLFLKSFHVGIETERLLDHMLVAKLCILIAINLRLRDTDIMWLRNPFNQFYNDADFQIACDHFNGDSNDLKNSPNGGFIYLKSNYRTIWFYKFWYNSRSAYPGKNEQDVLNVIKMNPIIQDIKLKTKFLSTTYFSGFCELSKEFNKVCTLHANCCGGLERKVKSLKMLFQDWAKYNMELSSKTKLEVHPSWSVPQGCK